MGRRYTLVRIVVHLGVLDDWLLLTVWIMLLVLLQMYRNFLKILWSVKMVEVVFLLDAGVFGGTWDVVSGDFFVGG